MQQRWLLQKQVPRRSLLNNLNYSLEVRLTGAGDTQDLEIGIYNIGCDIARIEDVISCRGSCLEDGASHCYAC